jgi:hypothetical protein
MKLINPLLFLLTFALHPFALDASIIELRSDSLSEVIVKGKKIGYVKLLKDCYANFTKVTPGNFNKDFSGYSVLTRNEKLQFELNGILRVDFVNYLNFNHFFIAKDCKYLNNIRRSKNENLPLYPLALLDKLELSELKTIIKSSKYVFKPLRENNEIVELAFAPERLVFESQKEIKSLSNIMEIEESDKKRFLYKGTIIINKRDLAFEKIVVHLLKSPKNTTVSVIKNFKPFDKYLIEEEHFEYQFKKLNNYYHIVSFNLNTDWRQIDLGQSNEIGNFKLREHYVHSDKGGVVFNPTKFNLYTISHTD